jgi:hypothetical protein
MPKDVSEINSAGEETMRICSRVGMSLLVCLAVGLGAGQVSAQNEEEGSAQNAIPQKCAQFPIKDDQSTPLGTGTPTTPAEHTCHARKVADGKFLPDLKCTPGAFNNTVTAQILRNHDFTTKCLRNDVTSEEQKSKTYEFYGIPHPVNNKDDMQICELDHLVPLELGGADTLDNIWPQCGPDGVTLKERFFKQKDKVEDWLAAMVRNQKMGLDEARKNIASDWTQFLNKAQAACNADGQCVVE